MAGKKIFITREVDRKATDFLKEQFEVVINKEDRILTKAEIIESAKDCDALLCMLSDTVDKELMDACSKLKIVANYAVGYNNIDIPYANKKEIIVTNTPDVLTDATAELAMALLFAAARKITESDRFVRDGKFKMWAPGLMLGQEITGKTLGVIGAGRIGKAFAVKCAGLGMKLLYHNRKRDEGFEKDLGAEYVTLEVLLRESDYISIHVPLTKETHHLLDEKEFNIMKKTAVLINTSRGPVVNEKALAKALKEGTIWSAGLDVYENEPQIEEGLLRLDNVVLLPHIGSATFDTRANMAMMAARNIEAVLNGRQGINQVR